MACRTLTPADFEDAHALYRELTGDVPVAGRVQFEVLLGHEGTRIFGVQRAGRIVSMATLHLLPNMTQSGRLYGLVENVVTLRAVQGQGYGRAVMEALVEAAWQADAYKIMLLTGKVVGAKGFYERLGFSDGDKHGMSLRRVPLRK